MSPLDEQLIARKVKLIEEDLDKLKPFLDIAQDEYLQNYEKQLVVERLLEKIIGRMIDINYHLLKEKFNFMPEGYFQSFIKMGQKGQIEHNLAENIAASAGLRNILAHQYDSIDPKKVFAAIKKVFKYVPEYLSQVLD